ncbi:GGDEF domain-containing protein [Streptomyces sp. NPDC014006]|uniref:GGDEF domain-containing protein n=1 Tax=Streptomyces sp. NPDC014006 TaxID=3364870 RepID=UPI0036F5298A
MLLTSASIPLTGWTVHAVTLHRRLAASRRDPLTGLLRRDAYTGCARQVLRRHGDDTAVVMVDADRFKQINDTVGHPAGDAVLAVFGARLTAWAGPRAAVGRLGATWSPSSVDGASVLAGPDTAWRPRTAWSWTMTPRGASSRSMLYASWINDRARVAVTGCKHLGSPQPTHSTGNAPSTRATGWSQATSADSAIRSRMPAPALSMRSRGT